MCEVCGGDCKLCRGEMKEKDLLEEYNKIADTFDGFTRLMRKKFPLEPLQRECHLPEMMIERVQDIGKAQAKLKSILDYEIFDSLSKHNEEWHHPDPDVHDRLQVKRMEINCMRDDLWDLWAILRKEDEEL